MLKTSYATLVAAMLLIAPNALAAERQHILPGAPAPNWQPSLLVREQPPASGDRSHPVLYVHGASFPSALSVMFRFDGKSWADALNDQGYDAFGLDFAGYGGSERYPGMAGSEAEAPLGRTEDAVRQIERAVAFIRKETGAKTVSIIAHSWGTMPAARFAELHPDQVGRLVLFGPILRRDGPLGSESTAWTLVTNDQQHRRFIKDVPAGHASVLEEADFPAWAATYLASDPEAAKRAPPAIKIPSGPSADVLDAWSGKLPYAPSRLKVPVMVVRGAWDSSSTAKDAERFMAELPPGLERRFIEIPEGTHLLHLETGRHALYAAVDAFLAGR
jgi:pimeloyl-ACP methyl ester carboxylesterase